MPPANQMFGVLRLETCALPFDIVEELVPNGKVISRPELLFYVIDNSSFRRVAGELPRILLLSIT